MPDDAGLLTSLGVFLSQQRNFAEAIYLLRKAAERAPWSCEILNTLGMCWATVNRPDVAIACLEKALTLNPEFGLTYYDLAMVLSQTNRQHEAIARLEAARATRPGFRDADEWLQRIYERLARA
jgi:tetratricopeptide (TPR) repeat protein